MTDVMVYAAEEQKTVRGFSWWYRRIAAWGAPTLLIVLIVWHWHAVNTGTSTLLHADQQWLLLAGGAVMAMWFAGGCCQLGSTTAELPFGRFVFAQVAGSFANQVLPAGLGGAAVNLRMLRRCGLTRASAAHAVALNAAAGAFVRLAAMAVLLAIQPDVLPVSRRTALTVAACLLVGAVLAGVVVWRISNPEHRWRLRLSDLSLQTRLVLRHPRRAGLLWTGSIAIPILQILTLLAILHSLDMSAPVAGVALAFLGATTAAALIPTPGGFGSFDVTLLATLAAAGVTTGSAIGAVIGYRFLTVWLPALPGAATFVLLMRRQLI